MHDGAALPHVLFCIGGLGPGGSEMQLVSVVERLHGTRLRASVVTLSPTADPALVGRLEQAGAELRPMRAADGSRLGGLVAAAARMNAFVVRRRPDAIYAWLEEAALFSALPAKALRVPFVVARRNIYGAYAGRRPAIVRAIHLAERQARIVTVNSRAVRDVTIARGVPAARVRLIENGHRVDVAPVPPPDGEVVIGYVAGFRAEKGHVRLLDALERVRTDVPWRVDLAGDGALRPAIEADAARRGLDGRLRFLGGIEDTTAFWAERHIAALLSDHEGSPNALIEAALAERPIVATAVGGVPDVVGDDGGRLVPADDPAAIAAALTAMIESAPERAAAGAAARSRAIERFSIERCADGHWMALAEALPHERA